MPDSDSGAKDRTAVLDAHAKLAYDSWNKRREYEWKLTIGFWSVLVLPVGFTVREVRVDPMGYSIVAKREAPVESHGAHPNSGRPFAYNQTNVRRNPRFSGT
jgi:hypothetical protein